MGVDGANLIDRVCSVSKMDSTASSADRALILTWLQEGAETICLNAGITVPAESSVSLTSGTAEYVLGTSPFNITGILEIISMRVTDASVTNSPVELVSMEEIDVNRQGSQANATPMMVAVDKPAIVFHPTPGASTTVKVRFTSAAPTIADSSTDITFLPDALLWGTLGNFGCARALQYKQQGNWTDYWNLAMEDRIVGLPAVRRHKAALGGRQRADSTPSPVVVTSPSQDLGW